MVGPLLLGITALVARRVPIWVAAYPIVMLVGGTIAGWTALGSYPLALTVQGLVWLGFAALVYTGRATARTV